MFLRLLLLHKEPSFAHFYYFLAEKHIINIKYVTFAE